MNRRDILKMIVAATGTAFVGANALAYEMTTATPLAKTGFSKDDLALLNEIGEVIIPATDTPGAKAANVGAMIAIMVADCYTPAEQKVFKQGLIDLNKRAKSKYQRDFLILDSEQKMQLLSGLDEEANAHNREVAGSDDLPHYFSMFKQQVLFTFFTSEIGATKVLRHIAIPGKYDGEYPYEKGDRAWAT